MIIANILKIENIPEHQPVLYNKGLNCRNHPTVADEFYFEILVFHYKTIHFDDSTSDGKSQRQGYETPPTSQTCQPHRKTTVSWGDGI